MFEIFERALKEQGIADGYVTSVYYPCFNQNGDLVSSFGGGSPWLWYDAEHNEVKFGGDSDTFKTYLACMNAGGTAAGLTSSLPSAPAICITRSTM